MKIPQRRQQTCSSSYISTRSRSKGPSKEDERKTKSLETNFKSSGAATCHHRLGKKKKDNYSEEQSSRTARWCNSCGAPASLWGQVRIAAKCFPALVQMR